MSAIYNRTQNSIAFGGKVYKFSSTLIRAINPNHGPQLLSRWLVKNKLAPKGVKVKIV